MTSIAPPAKTKASTLLACADCGRVLVPSIDDQGDDLAVCVGCYDALAREVSQALYALRVDAPGTLKREGRRIRWHAADEQHPFEAVNVRVRGG